MDTGATPSAHMAPSTEALYRAALGPNGVLDYLPMLERFEARGRAGPVWHLRAALGNLAWLVYWRLWAAVLAQAGLTVAGASALGWLWTHADRVPLGVRLGLTVLVCALWCAVPGWWGLVWLHASLRQRVAIAVAESDTFNEAVERLARAESVWRIPGVGVALGVVTGVALLAGLAWQQWHEPPATEPDHAASAVVPPPVPLPVPLPVVPHAPAAPVDPVAQAPAREAPEAVPVAAAVVAAQPLPAPVGSGIRPRVKGFGVNVGMFAVSANADRVKARLADAGLPVIEDPIESSRGPLTRVRVGPFERRDQAEAAAKTVRALGLDARVYAP